MMTGTLGIVMWLMMGAMLTGFIAAAATDPSAMVTSKPPPAASSARRPW